MRRCLGEEDGKGEGNHLGGEEDVDGSVGAAQKDTEDTPDESA